MTRMLTFILILASCAPLQDDRYMIGWVGLPVAELRNHSYFSKLTPRVVQRSAVRKSLEYFEPPGQRTRVQCEQVGGCVGLQYLRDCSYEFEIESTIIISASLHGRCRKDPRFLPEK